MGMRLQSLPPSVQDAQETDLRAEVFRIGGDFQQRRSAGVEQELKEHFLVLPDERNQRVWHAEDQVVIVGRQQLLLASGQPLVTSVGLALGAMAIAARNGGHSITCLMESNSLWRVESVKRA